MVSVIGRAAALATLAATLVAAAPAGATLTTLTPPYAAGPRGGDSFNIVHADPTTGEVAILRANPVPINSNLGCSGAGGWATFAASFSAPGRVTRIVAHYSGALTDPYTFLTVDLVSDGAFVDSVARRGPLAGNGYVVLEPRTAASGALAVRVGMQVSSACLNADGGRAVFDRIVVETA